MRLDQQISFKQLTAMYMKLANQLLILRILFLRTRLFFNVYILNPSIIDVLEKAKIRKILNEGQDLGSTALS